MATAAPVTYATKYAAAPTSGFYAPVRSKPELARQMSRALIQRSYAPTQIAGIKATAPSSVQSLWQSQVQPLQMQGRLLPTSAKSEPMSKSTLIRRSDLGIQSGSEKFDPRPRNVQSFMQGKLYV